MYTVQIDKDQIWTDVGSNYTAKEAKAVYRVLSDKLGYRARMVDQYTDKPLTNNDHLWMK